MDTNTKWAYGLGAYLIVFIAVLIILLIFFWPKESTPKQKGTDPNVTSAQGLQSNTEASIIGQCPVESLKYIALVLIIGALGASLHGITSLAYHCSQNNFSQQWNFWYIFRPFAGGILALIFYLIIKGGFMAPGGQNENLFYVILGVSGMIGLFSNQALDRLSLIFDAMFASKKDKDAKFIHDSQIASEQNPADDSKTNRTTKTTPKKEDQ